MKISQWCGKKENACKYSWLSGCSVSVMHMGHSASLFPQRYSGDGARSMRGHPNVSRLWRERQGRVLLPNFPFPSRDQLWAFCRMVFLSLLNTGTPYCLSFTLQLSHRIDPSMCFKVVLTTELRMDLPHGIPPYLNFVIQAAWADHFSQQGFTLSISFLLYWQKTKSLAHGKTASRGEGIDHELTHTYSR